MDELTTIYKFVVLCTRREQDLKNIAASGEFMVGICDKFAARLSKIKAQHPGCGAELYYDKVLDLRNKCHRLQEMHT